ncbi:hypothetical protein E2C01_081920 [Portunus trituberculatus]|uniref:Uncharacterized protein n=1 Tax=Portunus trituberculatus TaxID=210409 RepID=A0A5B7IT50_PORTR|nr:hypothetical protein [Portunus trituberculatus]
MPSSITTIIAITITTSNNNNNHLGSHTHPFKQPLNDAIIPPCHHSAERQRDILPTSLFSLLSSLSFLLFLPTTSPPSVSPPSTALVATKHSPPLATSVNWYRVVRGSLYRWRVMAMSRSGLRLPGPTCNIPGRRNGMRDSFGAAMGQVLMVT